ncbi:hypothetical protein [Gloeobacter violaceus]|nr:hypothetical protein [Gloeobacter violaceus]
MTNKPDTREWWLADGLGGYAAGGVANAPPKRRMSETGIKDWTSATGDNI